MRYLYIYSDRDGSCVFPCDSKELKLTLEHYYNKSGTGHKSEILENWPSNSHGPAYPMDRYNGIIILDLQTEEPTTPMTKEELDVILDD